MGNILEKHVGEIPGNPHSMDTYGKIIGNLHENEGLKLRKTSK